MTLSTTAEIPRGEAIGRYTTYADAQKAVDYLADQQFEVVAGTSIEGDRNYVEIQNVKQTVPELPNTGSNGQLWLTAGGAALLLLALSGVAVSRSRRAKA